MESGKNYLHFFNYAPWIVFYPCFPQLFSHIQTDSLETNSCFFSSHLSLVNAIYYFHFEYGDETISFSGYKNTQICNVIAVYGLAK